MNNFLYALYMSTAYAVWPLYLGGEKQRRPNQVYRYNLPKLVSRLIGALPALLELSSETGMQR